MKLVLNTFFGLICLSSCVLTLTLQERKEFLHLHNYLRRAVTPSAADMQELEYDESIEKNVTEYLEKCIFDHQRLYNYGENGRLASDANITNSVVSWFQERIYFNISAEGDKRCSKNNTNIDYLLDAQCGHYKMMVRSTLKSIGCGYKFCKNARAIDKNYTDVYLTFCFYNAGQKDQPYEIGKICTGCDNAYQFCNNDLCVPKERYDKNSRSCKVICQNCGIPFIPKINCLCDCPSDTDGNSCKGTSKNLDKNCTFCKRKGLSCNSGSENIMDENCSCKCNEQHQGEYCEIRKNQFAASYYHIIDGLPWRHGMNIPVNLLEFKNSFSQFQSLIQKNVETFCMRNKRNEDCKEMINTLLYPNNVLLIPGFPLVLENGSIALRMFFKNSMEFINTKEERFVPTAILKYVWNNPSRDLEELIDNVKRIYPIRKETSVGWNNKHLLKLDFIFIGILFHFYYNDVNKI